MSVSQEFKESVKRNPDKIAVYFGDREITYVALNEEVERIAAYLLSQGFKAQDRLAIYLPNCPEFITAYLATQQCGGTAVTINPMLKGDEITYILNDAEVSFIFTSQMLLPMVESVWKNVPMLQSVVVVGGESDGETLSYEDIISEYDPTPEELSVSPDDVAACLYTSGTTGKPKGALLTNDNLVFDVWATINHIQLTSDENFLSVLPLFHSFGQTVCMLIPLILGATITLVAQFRPDTVLKEVSERKVTLFGGVPAMYASFLNAAKKLQGFDISSLGLCFSGGAALPVEVLRAFEDVYHIDVVEGNGPTETSPVSYANPRYGVRKPGSVGLPLEGVEVKIVNDNDETLPTDEVGEICVRGRNVMKGYLKQPEATAEAMRGGWFHTGDLGKIDEDGYVYIVDRKKDMIIVGGLNVYPREVEEVIYQNPKVSEAVVVGKTDKLRGEIPVACIIPKEGETIEPREIIMLCREKLANYKVPKEAIMVQELPKTSTGKVDKKALREALELEIVK